MPEGSDDTPDSASGEGETGRAADSARPRLFGRHKAKRLRPRRQALMEDLLPRLKLRLGAAGGLDPHSLYDEPMREVWLEIGYGGGEHLSAQAAAHPDVGLIGCEFFVDGVAKLLAQIEAQDLTNVRLHDHDARDVLEALQPASLHRVFLLFPDPWPKTRHHKRRFVQSESLAQIARALRPGGLFRVASDIPAYIEWTLRHLHGHPAFQWLAERPADWRERPADWPATRYEAKALREGRVPSYLTFRRTGP